jgi:hypothetical protein
VNVGIVLNKHSTIFFGRLKPFLEHAGHQVFWISPSRRWTVWLREHAGVSGDRILSLPDRAREWKAMRDAGPEPLLDLEGPSGVTISNLILMCRNLRRLPTKLNYAYLTTCRKYIEPFLDQNAIDVCFGEPTWGFEILVWLICQRRGISYLHPHTTRIPDDRFAFFDALPHELIAVRPVHQSDRDWASDYYRKWVARPRRPVYSTTSPSVLSFRRHWWEELGIAILRPGLDRDDLTLWPISQRIRSRARGAFNRLTLRAFLQFKIPEQRKYVLLCLHLQPESTIDVFGRMHSDQAHLVERIARLLPSTHELWVKQHVDALGDWSLGWLRKLSRLPNVRLIDPQTNTFDLIRGAALVVSVAGTVSYEAALLGTPAVSLAPGYFSPLMSLDPEKYPDPVTWPWEQILGSRPAADETSRRAIEFLAWIHAQSFPGYPCDPITVRNFGSRPENVEVEAAGFLAALDSPDFPRRPPAHPMDERTVRQQRSSVAVD